MRRNFHAFFHKGYACREQAIAALDLHQAKPAAADFRQPVEVTKSRNQNPRVAGGIENRLFRTCTHVRPVDEKCFDAVHWTHAGTSAGEPISQTPARHLFSSMCSRYSSLK